MTLRNASSANFNPRLTAEKKIMTYTLYGSQGSGSAAIEVALRRCNLPCRIVRAATWEADSALAELRQVNPLQQIPTLVLPDGSIMTESAAILIHLGLSSPASALLPERPSSRAQAIRGLVFIAANLYSAIGIIDYPQRWTIGNSDLVRDELRQGAKQRLHATWEIFDDCFFPSLTPAGDQPGALDILAAVVSKWSGTRAYLGEHRPEFAAALKRIDAHESVAPTFAEHWPEQP